MITSRRKPFIDVELIRRLMYWSMVIAGGVSLFNLIWGRARWLAAASFVLILLTLLLGAHKVQVNDFAANTPCIGLDWFILDLLGSALIFIFVEKLFALRKNQPVFRPEWQTDFHHFIVNHMVVGNQPLGPQAVRLGRQRRHSRLGAKPAIFCGAFCHCFGA